MRDWTPPDVARELKAIATSLDRAGAQLWAVYLSKKADRAISGETEQACRSALAGSVEATRAFGSMLPATARFVEASDEVADAGEVATSAGHAFTVRVRTVCGEYPELFGPGDVTCLALLELAAYWDRDGDPSGGEAPRTTHRGP